MRVGAKFEITGKFEMDGEDISFFSIGVGIVLKC